MHIKKKKPDDPDLKNPDVEIRKRAILRMMKKNMRAKNIIHNYFNGVTQSHEQKRTENYKIIRKNIQAAPFFEHRQQITTESKLSHARLKSA